MHEPRSINDRLRGVLGIVQDRILADDSLLISEKMFGTMVMKSNALEEAAHLLADLIPEVDELEERDATRPRSLTT